MATASKPLEADKLRRQCRCNVNLTLKGRHWIFFSAQHKRRALHACEVGQQVESVRFSTWPYEPLENFRICHCATRNLGMAGSARVKRKCDAQPGVERFFVSSMPSTSQNVRTSSPHCANVHASFGPLSLRPFPR